MPNYYETIRDLDLYDVFYEETGLTTDYFDIINLPSMLSYGKHHFLLSFKDPAQHQYQLREGSSILFEFKDRDGTVVYSNTTPYDDVNGAALCSVWVRENPLTKRAAGKRAIPIANGTGTLTVLAELDNVPEEWQDIFNYKLTVPVEIRKELPNDSPLIFALQKPSASFSEIKKPDINNAVFSQSYIEISSSNLETAGGQVKFVELSYVATSSATADYTIISDFELSSSQYEIGRVTGSDTRGLNPVSSIQRIPLPQGFKQEENIKFKLRFKNRKLEYAQDLRKRNIADVLDESVVVEVTSSFFIVDAQPLRTKQLIVYSGSRGAGSADVGLAIFKDRDDQFVVKSGSGAFAQNIVDIAARDDVSKDDLGKGGVKVGLKGEARGDFATSLGFKTIASGAASVAIGSGSQTFGSDAVSIGSNINNVGNSSVGIGPFILISGSAPIEAVVIGNYATGSADRVVAIGSYTVASGTGSIAMGRSTKATGLSSVAIGDRSSAAAVSASAFGSSVSASAVKSVAIGNQAYATAANSIAMGSSVTASAARSIVIGTDASSTGTDTIVIGRTVSASMAGSVAIGERSYGVGANQVVLGSQTYAIGHKTNAGYGYEIAIGGGATVDSSADEAWWGATAIGGKAHSALSSTAIGVQASASQYASVAIGYGAKTTGGSSTGRGIAIGRQAESQEQYAIALGRVIVSGTSSFGLNLNGGGGSITVSQDNTFAVVGSGTKVGIGKVNPSYELDVNGTARVTDLIITGSLITGDEFKVAGNMRVSGSITAENYILSSSVMYMTQSFSSGSTIFGDTLDDTHQFTGSLTVTSSNLTISSTGGISGSTTSTGSFGSLVVADKVQGDLTISDSLTVNKGLTVNDNQEAAYDFSVKSQNKNRMLYSDSNKDRVGIGFNSPGGSDLSSSLHIVGDLTTDSHITASGNAEIGGDISISSGKSMHFVGMANTTWLLGRNIISDSSNIGLSSDNLQLQLDGSTATRGFQILSSQSTTPIFELKGSTGDLYVAGDISSSASSTGSFGYLNVAGDITASGTVKADAFESVAGGTGISFTDDLFVDGHITASGNISSSGDLTSNDLYLDEYIYHVGDNDTYLRFRDNRVNLAAGGKSAIHYDSSAGKIVINNSNEDVDFHVMAEDNRELLTTDAANNRVGINTATPGVALEVSGSISGSSTGSFAALHVADRAGIGTTAPFRSYGLDNFLVISGASNPALVIDDAGQASEYSLVAESDHLALRYGNPGASGVNLICFDNDGNTGIGTTSPGAALEVIGNISGSAISTGSFGQLHLGGGNSVKNPTLNFGDGDTGFYESSDDQIRFSAAGSEVFRFDAGGIFGGTTGNPYMIDEVATATNPVWTFASDTNTGIGRSGADAVSIIAGGVEGLNVTGTKISGSATSTGSFGRVEANSYNITSPLQSLTVSGNISASASSTGSFGMVHAADKIGIGTASPSGLLHLQAAAAGNATMYWTSDAGDDNHDKWYLQAADGGTFALATYGGGSWNNVIVINHTTGNTTFDGTIETTGGNISGSATSTGSFGKLHIGESSTTAVNYSDNIVINKAGETSAGLSILTSTSGVGRIVFGDTDNQARAYMIYDHNNDIMKLSSVSGNRLTLTATVAEFPTANYKISGSSTSTGSFGRVIADDVIIDNGNITIPATKKLYLDGGGDTYITEGSGNQIQFFTNGNLGFGQDTTGHVFIQATDGFYYDGGSDTFRKEKSADVLVDTVGGVETLTLTTTSISGSSITTGSFGRLKVDSHTLIGGKLGLNGAPIDADLNLNSSGNNNNVITIQDDNDDALFNIRQSLDSALMRLYDGGVETMTFDADLNGGSITVGGNVSGSATSTGSFGYLNVAGSAGFDEYIYHNGDANTFIRLQPDEINIETGGENMIYIVEGSGGHQADKVVINNDSADIDFQAKGTINPDLIRADAATNRVGIGVTHPAANLHISGTLLVGSGSSVGHITTSGNISGSATSTGSFGMVHAADKLGIGTTSPGELLHVFQSSGQPAIKVESDDNSASVKIDGVATSDGSFGYLTFFNAGDSAANIQAYRDGANDAASLLFGTQPTGGGITERMRILSTGKVTIGGNFANNSGIFNIAPASGTDPAMYFEQYTSATDGTLGIIRFGNRAVDGELTYIESVNDGATDSGYLRFGTEATGEAIAERMRITSTGNVGIGTTVPTKALQVTGDISASGDYYVKDTKTIIGENRLSISSSNSQTYHAGGGGYSFNLNSAGNFSIVSGSTNTFKIHDGTGEVVLGQLTYASETGNKLTVYGTSYHSGSITSVYGNISGSAKSTGSFGALTINGSPLINGSSVGVEVGNSTGVSVNTAGDDLFIGGSTGGHGLTIGTANNANAYIFFADTDANNSGLIAYQHADNAMRIFTSGSEQVRIDDSGNVGIGTTTVDEVLHVTSTSNPTIKLEAPSGQRPIFAFNSGDATRGQITFNQGDVVQSLIYGGKTTDQSITLQTSGSANVWKFTDDNQLSGSATSTGSFGHGYFDGNVGMGVSTTNGARLQLQGTSALNNTLHMGNYGVQSGRIVSEGSLFLNIDATDEDGSEGQAFYFGQGGFAGGEDTLMTILQTGKVGIGTAAPLVLLEVGDGGANIPSYMQIASSGDGKGIGTVRSDGKGIYLYGGTTPKLDAYDWTAGAALDVIIAENGGNVGIGTTAPQARLDVRGDVRVSGSITAQNYIVSSSVMYMTQSFSSGSTIFGDTPDDTHQFTGSLRVTGSGNHHIVGGNVGIGTASPTQLFHVSGAGHVRPTFQSSDDHVSLDIVTPSTSGQANIRFFNPSLRWTIRGTTDLQIRDEGLDEVITTFDYGTGNVGIGIASPDGTLHVHTATAGTVSPVSWADDLTVENSGGGGISILSPNANSGNLVYGFPADADAVALRGYQSVSSDGQRWDVEVGGVPRLMVSATKISGSATSTGSFGQLKLIQGNSPTNPTLNFGDGDTGFYESADDTIRVALGGTHYWQFGSSDIRANASNRFGIQLATPTSTVPVFTPNVTDSNTGIGWSSADKLSLVAGGVSILELTGSSGKEQISGSASSTGSFGHQVVSGQLFIDQNSDNKSILLDSEATTQSVIHFLAPATTTGWAINIDDLDSVTTGGGINIKSNASDTSTRNLLRIVNDHASATGTTGLKIQQDSTGPAIYIDGTSGIYINSGTDEDHTIVDMTGITGGGKLIWDDSEEKFSMNKGLIVSAGNVSGSSTSTGSFGAGYFDNKLGIGTTSPESELYIKAATPEITIQRTDNNNDSVIDFQGSAGNIGARVAHSGTANNLVFHTFTGSTLKERLTITGGSASTKISGSAVSTGSFGRVQVNQSTFTTAQNTDVDTGTEEIVGFPTGSLSCAFFDYVVSSGSSNMRAGTVMSVWDGTNIEHTDTSTNDIGNTTNLKLGVALTSSMAVLRATAASDNWSVKTLVRTI